jgi:hypothetical protein
VAEHRRTSPSGLVDLSGPSWPDPPERPGGLHVVRPRRGASATDLVLPGVRRVPCHAVKTAREATERARRRRERESRQEVLL